MDAHNLIFDFALVMTLLLLAPLLAARVRLPDVAALILAGVVVGEYGLGLFRLDITFELLGSVGLLYLMFLAGLEINLNDFQRYRKPGLVFGAATFLIPQCLGMIGARFLLGFSWPQAILLASMFASHTLIPLPIVQRLGLGRHRAVTTAIGGTIITDTIALLVLVVMVKSGAHGGDGAGGLLFWGRLAASLAALAFASLILLPRFAYWFFRRATPEGSSEFIFILAATFLTAYAAEWAGVEPIIGAFLAGLALSSLVPEGGVLANRLHFVGHTLFIPFFLLSVGMRVNIVALISRPDGWLVAAFMTLAVTFTKWLAARIGGRLLGYDRDEEGILFGLSINQAAATLAAVLIGVHVGLFGDDVLNGAILMILATCLIGPWITSRCARTLAERLEENPTEGGRETGRVLVSVSSPESAAALMDLALAIRPDRCTEAVYPLHVTLDGPDAAARVAHAERLLGGAVAQAVAANTPVIPLARLDTNAAGGILRASAEFRASMIVLGWRKRKRAHALLQDTADRVVMQAPSAILLHRPGHRLNTIKRLVVVAPPLIEHHAGFAHAVDLVRRAAIHAGARLLLIAPEKTLDAMDTSLRKDAPPHEMEALCSWTEVDTFLTKNHTDHDALLLLSARRRQLAWQPSIERLPREWAARWPEANLILLFPALRSSGESERSEAEDDASSTGGQSMTPVMVTLPQGRMPDALDELLHAALPGNDAVQAIAAELRKASPVPLSPQTVLLHIHTSHVASTCVVAGYCANGFEVDGSKPKPTDLVLLMSPADGAPEQHLRALASLARAVRNGTFMPRSA